MPKPARIRNVLATHEERKGSKGVIQGYTAVAAVDGGCQVICGNCELRSQCLRHPETTPVRQVSFIHKGQASPLRFTELMKQAIDSERGRRLYGQRMATGEPVFGNTRHNKRLNRFTLRGQHKVNTQWNLYCLMHNIEKLAHCGYAQRSGEQGR